MLKDKLYYYYKSLNNDINISFRLPKQLRDDFQKATNTDQMGNLLREFMINTIIEKNKGKEE